MYRHRKDAVPTDYEERFDEYEVGMDHRVGFPEVDLYPRYPLREKKVLKKVRVGETDVRCTPTNPLNNEWMIEDDNQIILHANHPFKPKGRKE